MPNAVLTYWKLHKLAILLSVLCLVFYYTFGYHLERPDFIRLSVLYAALFFLCYKLIQFEKWNFRLLLAVGIIFRLLFLFSIPNLSQDFYRFFWDGYQVLHGQNPYLFLPSEILNTGSLEIPNAAYLVDVMGNISASNYSNYPPFNQLLFALSAWLGGGKLLGSLISMRLILLGADIGILYYGRKLLKFLNRSPHLIFWYFLNPLVIIEGSGNVHFEPVMLFCMVWSLYLLSKEKWILSSLLMSLAISIKLIPLLFLPLLFKYLGIKRGLLYLLLTAAGVLITFIPFYDPAFTDHYFSTIGLWFSNFEFNASIYNVVKSLGTNFDVKPWELIKIYGKVFPILFIIWVACITLLRRNNTLNSLVVSMLLIMTAYLLLSTTVHPWYLFTLLILGMFTEYRYPLIWSATVILSYSAYANPDFQESMHFLIIEYLVVIGFMVYELFKRKGINSLIPKN